MDRETITRAHWPPLEQRLCAGRLQEGSNQHASGSPFADERRCLRRAGVQYRRRDARRRRPASGAAVRRRRAEPRS
eukprot:3254460-Prymnesium_polylepis.1